MRWVVLIVLMGVAALGFGRWRFLRASDTLERAVGQAVPSEVDLPDVVRQLAVNGLAPGGGVRVVVLEQEVEMRLSRGGGWQGLSARQVISTGAAGFAWVAEQRLGPVPKVSVIDAFANGRGGLQVWLGGALLIAHAKGAETDEAEAMRYLAELPWAPDAILGNPSVIWRALGDGRVEAGLADSPAKVAFLVENGEITGVEAKRRPASDENGQPTRMDWRGRFADYAEIGGRRVPTYAEVGYVWPDGVFELYFRVRMTGYRILD